MHIHASVVKANGTAESSLLPVFKINLEKLSLQGSKLLAQSFKYVTIAGKVVSPNKFSSALVWWSNTIWNTAFYNKNLIILLSPHGKCNPEIELWPRVAHGLIHLRCYEFIKDMQMIMFYCNFWPPHMIHPNLIWTTQPFTVGASLDDPWFSILYTTAVRGRIILIMHGNWSGFSVFLRWFIIRNWSVHKINGNRQFDRPIDICQSWVNICILGI